MNMQETIMVEIKTKFYQRHSGSDCLFDIHQVLTRMEVLGKYIMNRLVDNITGGVIVGVGGRFESGLLWWRLDEYDTILKESQQVARAQYYFL